MSDYNIRQLFDKYKSITNSTNNVNNNLKLRCEMCKNEFINDEINEFFKHLYCEKCLALKKKYRIIGIMKKKEGRK